MYKFICILFLSIITAVIVYASTCGCEFKRGDANNDNSINLSDVVTILNYLYDGGNICNLDRADVNDDGNVDESDAVFLLDVLFGDSGPIPHPYPEPGCDCTADDLEPCCSISTGTTNPTRLGIVSASTSYSQNTWDLATQQSGTDSVVITTQNDSSCAHVDSQALYDVRWQISDPNGVNISAITEGCVEINTKVKYNADYGIGASCFFYECPEWLYNELGVFPSELCVDAEFFFADPTDPSNTVLLKGTGGTCSSPALNQYLYEEYCWMNSSYYETNICISTAVVDSTVSEAIDCMQLKFYTEKNISYEFNKYGNPDLVESEAITQGASGYSVKLDYIEYEWCE